MLAMKAQASAEFLALAAVAVGLLAVSFVIYSIYAEAASQTQHRLEAEAICQEVSSFIGSLAAAGDGATADFALSKQPSGTNYTVWIAEAGNASLVKVDYVLAGKKMGVGCRFPFAKVTNASGAATFALAKKFWLNDSNGVVVIGQ